jgi:hypothetical protein
MREVNFSAMSIDQLFRSYRFHDQDRGTSTMEEECRRMYMIDGCVQELQRRGINPFTGNYRPHDAQ